MQRYSNWIVIFLIFSTGLLAQPTDEKGSTEQLQKKKDKDRTSLVRLEGLRWEKCGAGLSLLSCTGKPTSMNWWQARTYCKNLKLYNMKWRLPTTTELQKLLKHQKNLSKLFPNNKMWAYWTSTRYNNSDRAAEVVDMDRAEVGGQLLWKNAYVRCVSK